MNELDELRREIDALDAQLTDLFLRRMAVADRVGAWKRANGIPVLDAARERAVLAHKAALAQDPADKADVTAFFEGIMAISRRRQRKLVKEAGAGDYARIGAALERMRAPVEAPRPFYQGEPGAYAEEAAALFFGEQTPRGRADTWEGVFDAIARGEADYGVLPIENSSTGGIAQVYDLLAGREAYIVGEQLVRADHCLMALRGATLAGIREVCSHEQGLFQCAAFLKEHPDWRTAARLNTAEAAKFVAESGDSGKAAIGSRRAAARYGLDILAEGISSQRDNYTRFVVVSRVPERRAGSDKVSLLFTLPHRSGALHEIMTIFAVSGLNLLKLESRPIPGRSWEYRFFMDVAGDVTHPVMDGVLRALAATAERVHYLGNYPACALPGQEA